MTKIVMHFRKKYWQYKKNTKSIIKDKDQVPVNKQNLLFSITDQDQVPLKTKLASFQKISTHNSTYSCKFNNCTGNLI